MQIDWIKTVAWLVILTLSVSLMIVFALALHSQLAVGADGYAVNGVWRSYADYRERILWVPGVDAEPCTSGVIHLGGELYRVPQGVSNFKCMEERGEA